MKKVKSAIKRMPGIKQVDQRMKSLQQSVNHLQSQVDGIGAKIEGPSLNYYHLQKILTEIEHYQPTYHVAGLIDNPMRDSEDRCKTILNYLGDVSGMRMLDIGSSLGYVCYYFADRGAVTEGWEYNPKNAIASRLIGDINGINTTVKTKAFDNDSVQSIADGQYDVVTILSVLHHTIYYNSLEYTQRLIKELFTKVPTVIVELAQKGEDTSLYWDKKLPNDALDVFKLVKKDVTIKKIGEFSNHLSKKSRPLYVVSLKKNTVQVNQKTYIYDDVRTTAYKNSMVDKRLRRKYYFTPDHVIKQYQFKDNDNDVNKRQIISEINTLTQLKDDKSVLNMVDFSLSSKEAFIVMERIQGELLVDIIERGGVQADTAHVVARDVLRVLIQLEKQNMYHNDIRSWNIIYNKDRKCASLIDYGLTSPVQTDNDRISLLWVLNSALTGTREGSNVDKGDLPASNAFSGDKSLTQLYDLIKKDNASLEGLLGVVDAH